MADISASSNKPAWRIAFPAAVGFFALAILVGGIGVWSTQTELAGAIVSPGIVEVQTNRQVVQHPDGGVVGEIFVRDGDRVNAGDMLIRFDDTFLSSELTIVQGQLFELLARKARLEAERDGEDTEGLNTKLQQLTEDEHATQELVDGQRRLFIARAETMEKQSEQLREQKTQIESEIKGTQAQLVALREQVALIEDELEDQESLLTRGLTQTSRVSALKRESANLNGEIGQLEATVARLKGQIASTEIEIVRLGATRREEAITTLRDLQFREIELAERRLSLREQLSRMDIRAPVSGVVYGSTIFALQSVVQPAEPMMYVVPQDTPLKVTARVDAINVDQLHVGQAATLRFTAFNQRQTPEIDGHVATISADVFTDEKTGYSFYRAELYLDEGQLDRLHGQVLLPGMPVETLIKTDERTPLSYLTKPLTDYFVKAFRE